jgi:nitrogen regulatory protein PII 2
MKEVMAILRMNRMNATKQALSDAGISSFHASQVQGRGRGGVDWSMLEGAKAGVEEAIRQLSPGIKLVPKRLVSVVVPDALVEAVVGAIIGANKTGQPGDGKIFVLPVSDAVRVRTSECGDMALNEVV